ncbi:methyltransferase [Nonomuraea phyllanthi]|uniref:thiopeptide-type bacteriocin biosynthesis protein n=1 Tax=Nonomuraea phyllanthi TaxID=2219224 RepID=UPI001293977D|nr:thiopeptide-type bacteriocin biosynthesis protein [Nonomuraea phyllanthi]QFY11515.1 methyltransferase [Nonomuraea phyllanthi]
MDPRPWRQVNVVFPDWAKAEHTAVTHLAPLLASAEDERLITAWFFMRKTPCWRIRYVPSNDRTQAHLRGHLNDLVRQGHIDTATDVIYEPEPYAFGGARAMACAHDLFHLDSRHLLTYLASSPGVEPRRELSILLCTVLMRSAGLEWYEQGDVWARVAEHRDLPEPIPRERRPQLEAGLRRLMSVDAGPLMRDGALLAFAAEWAAAFAATGSELADLAAGGLLHRGLRAILAHHIVFAWNRLGLSYTAQAVLSHTAKQVAFGCDPTASEAEETRSKRA